MKFAIAVSLVSVLLYYLIYIRHFRNFYRLKKLSPSYLKHIESFLIGVLLALIISLAAPWLDRLLPRDNVFVDSFLKAALIEKAGALISIMIIQRKYHRFSIVEGIISGITMGTGFALVENILYVVRYGEFIIIARTLFSTPIHITTCGIIGYYIARMTYFSFGLYRFANIAKAITLTVIFHGFYDLFLIIGGGALYAVVPILLVLATFLEMKLADAKLVPRLDVFKMDGIDFEEWLLIRRQPRYDRWIQQSMGIPGRASIPFFKGNYGISGTILIAVFILVALAGVIVFDKAGFIFRLGLKTDELFMILVLFPASIAIFIALVGAVNPEFLKNSVIRIPIIFDAVIPSGRIEETILTFDITATHCFLRTSEPICPRTMPSLRFECMKFESKELSAWVTWENHQSSDFPNGSIVRFEKRPFYLYTFLAKYILYRVTRGIVFNLRLPGFQMIRRLFLQPSTVTHDEISCDSGTVLFNEGDEGNSFYYIKKGRIEFYKTTAGGERILVDRMETGQIFNEMAMLSNKKRTVSAICTEDSVLAVGDIESLSALIKNNPDFALALIQKLTQRIDNSQKALMENIEYIKEIHDEMLLSHRASLTMLLLGMGFGNSDGGITAAVSPVKIPGHSSLNANDAALHLRKTLLHDKDINPTGGKPQNKITREMEIIMSRVSINIKPEE
jgi:CRP-like cAMP-binding protein/RsiW-degrading membrane proteinase PrsW (M82 family)